jgi:hypothetical protein
VGVQPRSRTGKNHKVGSKEGGILVLIYHRRRGVEGTNFQGAKKGLRVLMNTVHGQHLHCYNRCCYFVLSGLSSLDCSGSSLRIYVLLQPCAFRLSFGIVLQRAFSKSGSVSVPEAPRKPPERVNWPGHPVSNTPKHTSSEHDYNTISLVPSTN